MNFSFWKPFSYLSAAGAAGGAGYGATHNVESRQKNNEISDLKAAHSTAMQELKDEYEGKLKTEKDAHNGTKAVLRSRMSEGDLILKSVKHYTDTV